MSGPALKINPRVSIILPTFNRSKEIGLSIESVLSQTYGDFELIVIDDASEDDTESVVKGFDDPRVKYVRLPVNVGGGGARNAGIKESSGGLIAFQDSDDVWHREKLSCQLEVVDSSPERCGLWYTAFSRRYDARKEKIIRPPKMVRGCFTVRERLLRGNFIGMPTVVIKRDLLVNSGGFHPSLRRFQDWELFLRLSMFSDFMFIDDVTVDTFFSHNSVTHDQYERSRSLIYIFVSNYRDIKADKELRCLWMLFLGQAFVYSGRLARAEFFLKKRAVVLGQFRRKL